MLKSISRQFGNPHGLLGQLVGVILAVNNNERINWLISEMNIKPDDKILEIGYGPGVAIQNISSQLTTGSITGIDISEVMMKQAVKRNEAAVQSGKVRLIRGTADNLNKEEKFDKIFGMNVHIFWKDPVQEIEKLKQLLNDSGEIILALQPRFAKTEGMVLEEAEKTKNYFRKAGLNILNFSMLRLKPQAVFCVIGAVGSNIEN